MGTAVPVLIVADRATGKLISKDTLPDGERYRRDRRDQKAGG